MSIIRCKIDVTKIEKARLFIGAKGKYLDCALIPTPNDKHGNSHMIVQDVSKEEREAGTKGPIIGNAKEFSGGNRQQPPQRRTQSQPDDDIAF